jgi:glycolate oxidase iron-sulfur subunit
LRCGACQAVCPVYREERREESVARGRIRLALELLDGRLEPTEEMARRFDACTSCGRCAAECPAGVRADAIIMAARAELVRHRGVPWVQRAVFSGLKARRLFGAGLRLAARTQAVALRHVDGRPDLRRARMPVGLDARRVVAPLARVPLHERMATDRRWHGADTAASSARPPLRALFFPGCLISYVYPEIGEALVRVLAAHGIETVVPAEQQCCGLPALVHGDVETAREIAGEQVKRLRDAPADVIVTACATCGISLKRTFSELLGSDPQMAMPVAELARRTVDVTELLSGRVEQMPPPGRIEARVTYHDPCHLLRGQEVCRQPRDLIAAVAGVELVEMAAPGICCGGAGSFSLAHPDLSLAIGARKAEDILATGADLVTTDCPGCVMQLTDALHQRGSALPVLHVVQLLDRAYRTRNGIGGPDEEQRAGARTEAAGVWCPAE